MVFRRRNKRTATEWMRESVYPRGGWRRAALYVWRRVTRLPDPPHRIARGVFAGIFICFTPLFGLHLFLAALLALIIRGNVVAALLATLVGNPLTFPFIAVLSVELGHLILRTGVEGVPASQILSAFAEAGAELWSNIWAIFGPDHPQWYHLKHFYFGLFHPYLIGGLGPGVVSGLVGYYVSLPMISAYQKLRIKRRRDRAEKLRARAAERLRHPIGLAEKEESGTP